jgi:hypothetical protein
MLTVYLFFGFQTDDSFIEHLNEANPHLKKLFITNSTQTQLVHITHNNQKYLGRFLVNNFPFTRLYTTGDNIQSIVRRMIPEITNSQIPLEIFPVTQEAISYVNG